MSNQVNLEVYGADCVAEAAYDMLGKVLDFDTLAQDARDRVGADAETACIYTHNCLDIIQRYESEFGSEAENICDSGETYKASDYLGAMTAYANAIAYCAVGAACESALEELQERLGDLNAAAEARGADISGGPIVTGDCLHGWSVHESETAEGVHYWAPAELDGCHAVAIRSDCGLWLSYTWNAKQGGKSAP